MAKDNHKGKKMILGVVWNYASEHKPLFLTLLFLCPLIPLFHSYVQDLRGRASIHPPSSALNLHTNEKRKLEGSLVKRNLTAYGSAAYNFILMSAYRGGLDTFAIIGLSSKPLHLFSTPTYLCQWIPHTGNHEKNITVDGYIMLPDWGYGRVYTVVVVNCTFPFPVGHDGRGGRLIVHASTSGGGDSNFNLIDIIEALTETAGSLNASRFNTPPQYEYLYCGSPLFGNISPQRVREWIAYHVKLFGEKSHFVLQDAGGVSEEIMEVLRPWIEKGYVTLHDINEQERFDGYYHNQFLILNDCLHRYKFMTKWMFFFDVDEFIYVLNNATIRTLTDSLSGYTHFTIKQRAMSDKLCYVDDNIANIYRKWGIEKLVFRDRKIVSRRDRKYAVQPRNVFSAGVHMSQNLEGKMTSRTEGKITYYHYHGVIKERQEPCSKLVNTTEINVDGTPYVVDTTMREAAEAVKIFELRMIGPVLQKTHQ